MEDAEGVRAVAAKAAEGFEEAWDAVLFDAPVSGAASSSATDPLSPGPPSSSNPRIRAMGASDATAEGDRENVSTGSDLSLVPQSSLCTVPGPLVAFSFAK